MNEKMTAEPQRHRGFTANFERIVIFQIEHMMRESGTQILLLGHENTDGNEETFGNADYF